MDTFRDHKDEMPILVFPHLVKKIMNVMFLFEEIRGPTCVPVGDIYCHQIFLEVQVVITRILRIESAIKKVKYNNLEIYPSESNIRKI